MTDLRSHTLLEIGAELGGLTRERARQIEAEALKKLMSAAHRTRVERKLRAALGHLEAMRAHDRGLDEQLALALHIEDLTGALEWIDDAQGGVLEDYLRRK